MAGTIKEEATKLRQNIDKVYEAGRQSFHDDYQQGGIRTDYSCAYAGTGWTKDTFKPKHNIQPTNAYMMFRGSAITGDLVEILDELDIILDFSKTTNTQYMFAASSFSRIGVIDIRGSTNSIRADSLVNNCPNIEIIDKIIIDDTKTVFNNSSFLRCPNLKYIGFEGLIIDSLNFSNSPLLTDECVQGIIDHLATVATKQTLTFHADVYNKLTADQKTTIESKNFEAKSA